MILLLAKFPQNDPTDTLKEQVLGMFKKTVSTKLKSDDTYKIIALALEESKKISSQLKNAKRSGERCRDNAVWIGVMRYIISHMSRCY